MWTQSETYSQGATKFRVFLHVAEGDLLRSEAARPFFHSSHYTIIKMYVFTC